MFIQLCEILNTLNCGDWFILRLNIIYLITIFNNAYYYFLLLLLLLLLIESMTILNSGTFFFLVLLYSDWSRSKMCNDYYIVWFI